MEIDYEMPFMKCQIKVAIQYYTTVVGGCLIETFLQRIIPLNSQTNQ